MQIRNVFPIVLIFSCLILIPQASGSMDISVLQYSNVTFAQPTELEYSNGKLYVLERQGKLNVIDGDSKLTILDISDRVDSSGSEMGLLGVAFHPDFASNGYIFLDYTTSEPRKTRVSRFQGNATWFDPNSESVILEVEQPFRNHNAGSILFGTDGMLYITLGDGGSAGDPEDNGQDPSTLLGSVLRIDIDKQEDGTLYGIPSDNPFYRHQTYRGEIYAYGLRNPWKLTLDEETDTLIAGDVGQSDWEEVDRIEAGKNYGWNEMEGSHCYLSDCNSTDKVLPLTEYSHDVGNSITGGYVNRDTTSDLYGWYIYGDYGTGKIFGFQYNSTGSSFQERLLLDTDHVISTFGKLPSGAIIYADYAGGAIYKIVKNASQYSSDTTDTNSSPTSTFPSSSEETTNPVNTTDTTGLSWKHSTIAIIVLVLVVKRSKLNSDVVLR